MSGAGQAGALGRRVPDTPARPVRTRPGRARRWAAVAVALAVAVGLGWAATGPLRWPTETVHTPEAKRTLG